MNLKKTVYIGALASIAIVGCKDNTTEQEVVSITNGINVDLMDKTISPNEDFFQFINGTWLKNNTIPDDRTRWGSFDELRKMTDDDVLSIVNKAMNDVSIKENSDQAKALYLYKSILNTKIHFKKSME